MMNRFPLLCLPLLLAAQALCMDRTQADSLVANGQRLYLNGSYEEALAQLSEVEAEFDSPELQLGIGNCWYRLGDIPHAILHYERGLRLDPGDEDLRANLDLAMTQIKDRIPGEADHVVARGWSAFQAGSDTDQWARRSLWVCLAFFVLLTVARIVRSRGARRIAYGAAGLAALLLLLSIGFAAQRARQLETHPYAIILAPKTDARAEPRDTAKALFLLHRGSKVQVRDTTNGWCEVRLASGATGWLPARHLERI